MNHACYSGDAFVGRFHDDESMEWNRLDFSLEEASPDAHWVKTCAEQNKCKLAEASFSAI
jgi:hypothetical protein